MKVRNPTRRTLAVRDLELVLYKYVNVFYKGAATFTGKTRSSHSRGSRIFIRATNLRQISRLISAATPLWGAFLHVAIAVQVTEFVVNCVTSCHS